jgi:hypothetical protein
MRQQVSDRERCKMKDDNDLQWKGNKQVHGMGNDLKHDQ